jgi:uncharacterized membrane protein YdjX (TVP38/TMEM64 family)
VRSYLLLLAAMSALFLALFGIVTALEVPLLTDPLPWLHGAGAMGAAALGAGLLVADVFLPVPASLVMVAHGALFGVAAGTAVSLLGGLGAAAVGFAAGRRGTAWLHRLVPTAERRRADGLLARWGDLAVVATRPVPILAESVAILAGTTSLGWRRFLLLSLLGYLPPCLLYAVTGATASNLDGASLTFGLVLLVAAVVWWLGRRIGGAAPGEAEEGEAATGRRR